MPEWQALALESDSFDSIDRLASRSGWFCPRNRRGDIGD